MEAVSDTDWLAVMQGRSEHISNVRHLEPLAGRSVADVQQLLNLRFPYSTYKHLHSPTPTNQPLRLVDGWCNYLEQSADEDKCC